MELKIKDLYKSYDHGKTYAINDVSADFTPGIYGILGPNGAGKSTMFGMLTDNLRPDKGSITADGEDIYKMGADYRAKIGYMPQQQSLYEAFTAEKFLWYMAALKGMNRKDAREQIENLLEVVNLKEERYKKLKYFSGGMKQRILLAQALLNDPEILILDEPTAGMDPEERIRIRNFISGCAKDKIVLLATHVVADVENMAREILLIKNGKIVRRDTPQKFLAEIPNWIYSEEMLTVALPTYTKSSTGTIKAGSSLVIEGENLNWVSSVKFGDVEVSEITVSEDAKTLTVVVPATAKSGAVTLVCYSGAEVAAGKIATVVPTDLSAVPEIVKNGTDITITGKDLDLIVSATFPNVSEAVELKQGASATQITLTVPELAQDGDIALNLFNGESVTIAYKTLKPTIAVFTPAALTAGDTLIIAGTDLDLVSAIVFAGEDSPTAMLAKYNHISDELLGITVPGVAETCAPTLILKNGMEVKTTLTLNITPATDPAIATINPSAVVQGREFVITGKNLNTVEAFYIGEVKVTAFGKRTETEVEMTVPKTAATGVTAIRMVNYEGKEFTSDVTMEVLAPEATIWEGFVVLGNWANGCQDLAWGGYDWNTVVVGQTLNFYFEEDTSSTWWQLKLGQGDGWTTLPDFKKVAGGDAVNIY